MAWTVLFHDEFDAELAEMLPAARNELLAKAHLLATNGPALGRPHADTLNGSKFGNMKELRFSVEGGVWRAAFAFDPNRQAIILVAGNKAGKNQSRFYKQLVTTADRRYVHHMEHLEA
jgi:hypothetical protein